MLAELRILLEHVGRDAEAGDYTEAITEGNVLGKPTRVTRCKTAKRLQELYAIDPHYTLFRLLRHFWTVDPKSQLMLAFLVAGTRPGSISVVLERRQIHRRPYQRLSLDKRPETSGASCIERKGWNNEHGND